MTLDRLAPSGGHAGRRRIPPSYTDGVRRHEADGAQAAVPAPRAPARLRPAGPALLALQRSAGNAAVARAMTVQRDAPLGEKIEAGLVLGPDIFEAKEIAGEALAKAQSTGLPGLENGPADAFRHCYWNARMSMVFGVSKTKKIADNHERYGAGSPGATAMDYHNNHVGRSLGAKTPEAAESACFDKLATGDLRVLDDAGNPVPSTGQSGERAKTWKN